MPAKTLTFGNRKIGQNAPCFIIAEIGINHEGDLNFCMEMIKACAEAGADAIKLQTSDPNENYHPSTESYAIYKQSFFGAEETGKAFEYARSLGMEAFTTSGLKTLEWVDTLNPSGYKISSGLFSHFHLIEETLKKGRPLIVSTGLSEFEDIDQMIELFEKNNFDNYAILQCTSLYPCPDEHINLSSIGEIAKRYDVIAGLSDHSLSEDVPALAVASGAKIIEKHFSLDTSREGFDHPISLDFDGFKNMVDLIRRTETLLGSPDKTLCEDVSLKRKNMERYIFAAHDLKKGTIISHDDLLFLRAQNENNTLLSAGEFEAIIGSELLEDTSHLGAIAKNNVQK